VLKLKLLKFSIARFTTKATFLKCNTFIDVKHFWIVKAVSYFVVYIQY